MYKYFKKAEMPTQKIYIINIENIDWNYSVLLSTLQGLIANKSKAKVFLQSTNTKFALDDLIGKREIETQYIDDVKDLIILFKEYIKGYILFERNSENKNSDHSVNVANSLCYLYDGIAVEKQIADEIEKLGINEIFDCCQKDEKWLFDNYFEKFNRNFVIEITPEKSYQLRDYAVMSGAFVFSDGGDTPFREHILSKLNPDGMLLGWSDSEKGELGFISQPSKMGISTCPSDWSSNLSTLSSFDLGQLKQRKKFISENENNVHYLTIVMSDGDNEQWLINNGYGNEKWFNSKYKGNFNMSFAIPPTITDKAPTVLESIYNNAADGKGQDRFVIGPSGCGYMYPSLYPRDALKIHTKRLNDYMELTDTEAVLIIDENSFDDISLWDEYTKQPNIEGLFYLEYSLHSKRTGEINFSNGKPVIACTDILWQNLEEEEEFIQKINSRPTDKFNKKSYTMLYIHAWSKSMENVNEIVNRLNKNIRIVTPEDFIQKVKENLMEGKYEND